MNQPEPPYEGHPMASRWRETEFDGLPVGIQRQILRRIKEAEPDT